MTRKGIILAGRNYVTPVAVEITDIFPGVGQIDCIECGGDGDWTKFYPEPETLTEPMQCVTCKGTGRLYIST